jgi:hypothetical protein
VASQLGQGLHLAKFDESLVQVSFADIKVIEQLQGLFPSEKTG